MSNTGEESTGMGEKAKDYFDNKNKNALAAGVASAATDSSLLTQWFAQMVFSAINLGSHVSALNKRCVPSDLGCVDYEWRRSDKWTTTVESISLAFALIMTLAHWCCMKYATKYVLGKLPEGIVAFIVLAFVAAGMPAIMDPDNQQALDQEGNILNANLYFFSWAGLAVAVYIFCTWLFDHCFKHRNMEVGVPHSNWYMLLAAAVIVMSSSTRLLRSNCKSSDTFSDSYCRRTKFAVAAGAIGTFVALVATVLNFTGRLGMYPEAVGSFSVFVLFVLGIAFLTFGGDDAPADNVGNLYFSVWISFILAMFLASLSYKAIRKSRKAGQEEEGESGKAAAKDAPVQEPPEETAGEC